VLSCLGGLLSCPKDAKEQIPKKKTGIVVFQRIKNFIFSYIIGDNFIDY
jgi:hypothetical protein